MKLKKLEVNGFKSFPEKSTVQFPPGISAVVGPNGCGKSNLVDALRWVMGEQSVKLLRGKSMEDVIFSGSNGKAPLNMAEVSLTIVNDNGSAPEEFRDYTEIMLTRRLYRSGESAYFLNKRPCRLKDIHNLFMGSGISSKSYAMIQQGNIGAIIDAGPDERRFFIEEAAGVTRFKRRKEEALRKVNSTQQNLYRLNDIIVEIKRQMTSLKRQARKAELYQKYQDRIRTLDILINIARFDEYQRQIDETNDLLQRLQDTDEKHTTQLQQVDAVIEEIKLNRWEKNQLIENLKTRIFETQRDFDRTENDLAHHRQEKIRLADEILTLKTSHQDLSEKNSDIVNEIDQVEKHISLTTEEKSHVSLKLGQERTAVQEMDSKVAGLKQDLEVKKSELMDLIAEEARFKNTYQNVANNKESLNRRLKRLDEEVIQSREAANTCQTAFQAAQTYFDAFEKKISDQSIRIKQLQEELEHRKKSLGNQIKQVQTLELDRNKIKSRFTTLKKMEENFEWFKEGVQAIMKTPSHSEKIDPEFEKLKQEGLISIMADTIEPNPSYEIPVEAVLGESLQHILVKDQKSGFDFIAYLKSKDAGRSGFIPVTDVKPIENPDQNKPDPSKLLLNHVAVKPGFEKIAKALLGHVVVAQDIQEAQTIFNRNGSLQTVVTMGGDIISHQGILIGGSKDKISGILVKKQELKQLEQQMAQYDKAVVSARNIQQKLESEIRDNETNLQKQIEKKNNLLYDQTEAEKALYKAQENLKHAKRHFDIICLEQEQLTGEEKDLDEELVKYTNAVTEISHSVKNAQDQVADLSDRINTYSADMDRNHQHIQDIQLTLTRMNAQLENNSNNLKRLIQFRDEGITRLAQIAKDIEQKGQQQHISAQKISEFEDILSTMYETLNQLKQELESNETNYQAIDEELEESNHTATEIQNKREEISKKIRMIELEQSERCIKQDNISSRLGEQYRKSISNLRDEFDVLLKNREMSDTEMGNELIELRTKIDRISDVNLGAIKEFDQLQERFDFLGEQRDDLVSAMEDLHKVIKKINRITQERFIKTLTAVNEKLKEVFPRLFEGGSAQLVLTEPDKPLETGVEYMIQPQGKKITRMSLLSGGEKALAAIAFIFSIFLMRPASFCLMDEIDAPLDDANIYRFNDLLKIIGEKSQIIMITHNKKTMEFADRLFGVTMVDKGISKIVSVNLSRLDIGEKQPISA